MENQNDFDPSALALRNGQFFGLPYTPDEAEIVIVPVPWDVTTSYGEGTHAGPESILEASYQLDFTSPFRERAWETKISSIEIPQDLLKQNAVCRSQARDYIAFLADGGELDQSPSMQKVLKLLNQENAKLHAWTETQVARWLKAGKKVVTVGGDHSISYGAIKATSEVQPISILHVDAHADLRPAFEGFEHSHASIMDNALKLPGVEKLTQVGIRDLAPVELETIRSNKKVKCFFDWDLRAAAFEGRSWQDQCDQIVATLGPRVYISFDIDGLDPKLCPHTGTPVPGGLEFHEVMHLFRRVLASGRKIVGADLVEVAPGPVGNEWDGNVGARVLFNLCMLVSL